MRLLVAYCALAVFTCRMLADAATSQAVSDKSMEILKDICPDLVSGQGKEFCCDNDQVSALGTNLQLMRALISNCPSCFFNLARVFCMVTCSPHQDDFLEVTQFNKTTRAVLEVNYYMTHRYALGAFSSCSGFDSGILGALCGSYSDDCGPETLFMGLGMHDGLHSPFQMDFVFSGIPTLLVAVSMHVLRPNFPMMHPCMKRMAQLQRVVACRGRLVTQFANWGRLCARWPVTVVVTSLLAVAICCAGLAFFTIRTNPVELWSAPKSRARLEREQFNQEFGPFYRIEQVVITRNGGQPFPYTLHLKRYNLTVNFGAVFDKEFLHQVAALQEKLLGLTAEYEGRKVTLEDICFSPLSNGKCMIQSPLNWFQNNASRLDLVYKNKTYLDHLFFCFSSPLSPSDEGFGGMPCLGQYGGPVFPYVGLGNIDGDQYPSASALVITILVNNHVNSSLLGPAIAWERKFIDTLKNFSNENMSIAFLSENSVEDELDRESRSDVFTVLLSYFVNVRVRVSCPGPVPFPLRTVLVDSQVTLGLAGVVIVLASVASSLGLFSYWGTPATLIIIEVIPFLVLAVGVDNIFILVQGFQRDDGSEDEPIEDKVARVVGNLGPSLLLASFSEATCFFLR
ncbi:hypothetical protein MTO96_026104 [Rhipicephalus appendiculatus]